MLPLEKMPRVALVFGAIGLLLGLIDLYLCAWVSAFGFVEAYCNYPLFYMDEAQRLGINGLKLVDEGKNLALAKYALENGLGFILIPTSISYLCGYLFSQRKLLVGELLPQSNSMQSNHIDVIGIHDQAGVKKQAE